MFKSSEYNNNNNENDERNSIGIYSSNKKQTKSYGSLRNEPNINKKTHKINIMHKICAGETLQGISLKYGVSIEEIKKTNKIWTNDVAFIKEYLLIPIEKEKLTNIQGPIDYNTTLNLKTNSHIKQINENDHANDQDNLIVTQNHDSHLNTQNSYDDNDNYKKFLNKFDSIINESKLKLKHLENVKSLTQLNENSNQSDDSYEKIDKNGLNGYKFESVSQNRATNSYDKIDYTSNDLLKTPDFIIRQQSNQLLGSNNLNSNSARAKQAYETLQKLEKEKDDLYEL